MKRLTFKPIRKDFFSEPDLVYDDVKHVVETDKAWFVFRDQIPSIWHIRKFVYYLAD